MKTQNLVVNALVKAGKKIGKQKRKIKELKKENEALVLMLEGLQEIVNKEMICKKEVVSFFTIYKTESGSESVYVNSEGIDKVMKLIKEVKGGQEDE